MQPIFCSFASGLPYRKTVKLHFCRISTIDLLVSIYENMLFRLFSSFLTAGNKSKCGTLQRLTHPQQSTDEPIFRPVSPPKRQAMQGKSFVLSPISTQTSSHLRTHRTSVPSRPQKLPGALIRTKSAPQTLPQCTHRHTLDAPQTTPQTSPRRPLPPHPHSLPTPSHASTPPPSAPTLPPHPKVACNSQTGVTQQHKVIRTSKLVRGNCMRNCSI